MNQNFEHMSVLHTSASDKVHLSITEGINFMTGQGKEDDLWDPRGILAKCPALVSALVKLRPVAFLHMMNHNFIT
jgi:hypothetical protein